MTAAELLEVSAERDRWHALVLAAERAAYERGYNDGRAEASIRLAEIEERYAAAAWWREWSARLRRIIRNNDNPSVRMTQVMAEIHADQQFMREARTRLRRRPGSLSPLEWSALRRVRLAGHNADQEAA
jgi:hypothetical protein